MGAYELNQMNRMSAYRGPISIDPEQKRRVTWRVSFRTVTTMLLASNAAVLGESSAAAPKTSLAGLLNRVTRWHAA